MATFEFDFEDVIDYVRDAKRAQNKAEQKEIYRFLRTEGSKLRRRTLSEARGSGIDLNHTKPKKYADSKHYRETIKRGKAYLFSGVPSVRVYSGSPHAHLLEYGHEKIGHKPGKKSLGGRTRAFQPFEKAKNAFENQYYADCLKFYEGSFAGLW